MECKHEIEIWKREKRKDSIIHSLTQTHGVGAYNALLSIYFHSSFTRDTCFVHNHKSVKMSFNILLVNIKDIQKYL